MSLNLICGISLTGLVGFSEFYSQTSCESFLSGFVKENVSDALWQIVTTTVLMNKPLDRAQVFAAGSFPCVTYLWKIAVIKKVIEIFHCEVHDGVK